MDATTTLLEVFRDPRLVDQRRAQGLRHSLPMILGLTTVAILTGITSRRGVVQFGNAFGREFRKLFGSTRYKGPSEATLSRVFRAINVMVFEQLICEWIHARLGGRSFEHIAIDGKTARGSRREDLPAVHLLAAYASEMGAVLAQLRVDAKTNEHKAVLELLGILPLKGKVVTGDAMFTHRDVCSEIGRRGGDYVLPAKDNQPTLVADIRSALDAPPTGLSPPTETTPCREHQNGQSNRQGPWPARAADDPDHDLAERLSGLAARAAGLPSAS
jgi:DDE_Tnp_1-associated/Transposase DDE domain